MEMQNSCISRVVVRVISVYSMYQYFIFLCFVQLIKIWKVMFNQVEKCLTFNRVEETINQIMEWQLIFSIAQAQAQNSGQLTKVPVGLCLVPKVKAKYTLWNWKLVSRHDWRTRNIISYKLSPSRTSLKPPMVGILLYKVHTVTGRIKNIYIYTNVHRLI